MRRGFQQEARSKLERLTDQGSRGESEPEHFKIQEWIPRDDISRFVDEVGLLEKRHFGDNWRGRGQYPPSMMLAS
jgi:hypothetical protein